MSVSKIFAIWSKLESDGSRLPCSQFAYVLSLTCNFSAISFCVILRSVRSCIKCFPNLTDNDP